MACRLLSTDVLRKATGHDGLCGSFPTLSGLQGTQEVPIVSARGGQLPLSQAQRNGRRMSATGTKLRGFSLKGTSDRRYGLSQLIAPRSSTAASAGSNSVAHVEEEPRTGLLDSANDFNTIQPIDNDEDDNFETSQAPTAAVDAAELSAVTSAAAATRATDGNSGNVIAGIPLSEWLR